MESLIPENGISRFIRERTALACRGLRPLVLTLSKDERYIVIAA